MKLKQIFLLTLSAFILAGCASTKSDYLSEYSVKKGENVLLVDKSGKTIAKLDDDFGSICDITSYKDKIIIFGKMDFSRLVGNSDFGQNILILDKKENKIIDSFLCFYLTNPWGENRNALQSPSGRYLLYRKFHPASSTELATSNFAMLYDLDKSPAENKIEEEAKCVGASNACSNELYTIMYSGDYVYPDPTDFTDSACSIYKTQANDFEQYTYILGNKWDSPKTVLQISYPNLRTNDFLIIEETKLGLTKKLLKFSDAKILDKDGKEIDYYNALENKFYMVDFCIDGDTLSITNLADSSKVAKIVFKL